MVSMKSFFAVRSEYNNLATVLITISEQFLETCLSDFTILAKTKNLVPMNFKIMGTKIFVFAKTHQNHVNSHTIFGAPCLLIQSIFRALAGANGIHK